VPGPARRATPETVVAVFVAASVAVMAVGYLLDAVGLRMSPAALGLAAAAAGVGAFVVYRESSPAPRGSVVLCAIVTASAFAYLLWLASPSLLPVTDGPDVVHHLQLIHLIQRTHRLAHDPALEPYLVEMVNYTPGSHILAATVGGWLRVDPLRVLFPLTALFVAMKVGIVYMLAVRAMPDGRTAAAYALAAPVLLLVPAAYVIRSFFQFYFYAQVVSETFALAMVLTGLAWSRTRQARYLWLTAAGGVGVVLSWPVWIVPALGAVAVAILSAATVLRARLVAIAIAGVPVAFFILLHAATHPGSASIIGSSGAVIRPSAETLGIGFVALGVAGAVLAVRGAMARPIAVLLALAILQSLAIAVLDARRAMTSASPGFYMSFKMVYLAVLPCAVLGALALGRAADALVSRVPLIRRVAPVAPLLVASLLAHGRFPLQRQHSPITASSLAAGLWARSALPPECIDYFSRHWLTGYWLHLDVLGNPRLSDRMRVETFDFPDVVGAWIQGKGRPYAIVEDLDAVPRDARADMRPLHAFPPSAVVKNVRPGSDPKITLCSGK
jgi:hypothetical protein